MEDAFKEAGVSTDGETVHINKLDTSKKSPYTAKQFTADLYYEDKNYIPINSISRQSFKQIAKYLRAGHDKTIIHHLQRISEYRELSSVINGMCVLNGLKAVTYENISQFRPYRLTSKKPDNTDHIMVGAFYLNTVPYTEPITMKVKKFHFTPLAYTSNFIQVQPNQAHHLSKDIIIDLLEEYTMLTDLTEVTGYMITWKAEQKLLDKIEGRTNAE